MRSLEARTVNRNFRLQLTVWAAGLLFAAGSAVAGQKEPDSAPVPPDAPAERISTFLDSVVVTATKSEATDFDLPYSVERLDRRELLEHRQVRTLPEAMNELPGVMTQKTGHGQGSPFIRGFTGFRTLLMVDGIRLNNSVFRDGPNQYWNTVDPWSIDGLELVKGPSSALNGSDAIGGTVNVQTQKMAAIPSGTAGAFRYRYSSAEDSNGGRLQITQGDDRWRMAVGVSAHDFGDVDAGGSVGTQPKTDYDRFDGDFKLEIDTGDESRLVFAYQQTEVADAWRTHRTIFGKSWRGTTVGNERQRSLDQQRSLAYLQYLQSGSSGWFDTATANLSFHRQEEERFRIRSGGNGETQAFDVGTLGAWLQLDKAVSRGSWTYGLEYYGDTVDSFKVAFDSDGVEGPPAIQGPVADDATYDLIGAYAQFQTSLSDRLSLILGARYTHAAADAEKVQSPTTGEAIALDGSWDNLTGNFRTLYQLDGEDRWHLFGGVSQGFRAPNLSDLTRFDSARSNEIETPAPDLDSERFVAYELGLKFRGKRGAFELATFETDIEDLIVRVPTGSVVDGENEITKTNGSNGFSRGLEVSAVTAVTQTLELSGDIAWVDGEVDTFPTSVTVSVRTPLSRLMPTTGHLSLRWTGSGGKLWAEALLTVADRQDKLSLRDLDDTDRIPPGGTPGYELLSLRGSWIVNDRAELHFGLENLGDEEYRIHGSGLNGAGRGARLGITTRF